MKTHFISKRVAGILTAALITTGGISLLTPPLNSNNIVLNLLFSKNSNSYLTAEAASPIADNSIELSSSDITVTSNGTVTKFKPNNFNALTGNVIKVSFNSTLNIKKIDNNVFSDKFSGKKVILELPDSLEEIGENAFLDSGIVEIKFNDKLKIIGDSAFSTNPSLTNLKFGRDLVSIGNSAFRHNTYYPQSYLSSVEFNDNLKTIGNFAFEGQTLLTSLSFGSKLESIGESSFENTGLTSVKIGSNVKIIGEEAFNNIPSLTSVDFSEANSLEEIGDTAFAQAQRPIDWGNAINKPGLTGEVILPDSVKKIGMYAFAFNNISKVKLPNNLKEIGPSVFAYNIINDINWGNYDKVDITVQDGVSKPNLTYTGIAIPEGLFFENQLETVNIPETVTTISQSAFSNNKLKDSLIIPASVKYIYSAAFYNNNYDKTLTFNKDSSGKYNIETIGYTAFQNCGILGTDSNGLFTIPDSVKHIDDDSFSQNKFKNIDFNGTAPTLLESSFAKNPLISIKNLNMSNPTNEYGYRLFEESVSKSLKNVDFNYSNLHNNFNYLHFSVFSNGSLRSILFPKNIRDIKYTGNDSNAFYGNKGWYDGTNKVALYRVDSNKNYVLDNSLDDSSAKYYVFNPVLLEFNLTDKDGQNYDIQPKDVTIKRTNKVDINLSTIQTKDYTNFKLGDEITFKLKLTDALKGYELSNPGLERLGDDKYKIVLNPERTDVVIDTPYNDSEYAVGYKKTVISLKVKSSDGSGDTKEEKNPNKNDDKKDSKQDDNNKDNKKDSATKDNNEDKKEPSKKDTTKDNKSNKQDNNDTPDNTTTNNTDSSNQVTNPEVIPNDDAVFNLVDENGNPLGKAILDKDTGTYTLIDDDNRTPQGIAKINKDNTLEVIKIFNDKSPLGTLPKTGGNGDSSVVLLGASLIGLGIFVRKKLK